MHHEISNQAKTGDVGRKYRLLAIILGFSMIYRDAH